MQRRAGSRKKGTAPNASHNTGWTCTSVEESHTLDNMFCAPVTNGGLEVFDPTYTRIYLVPLTAITQLPRPQLKIRRLVRCRHFRRGQPWSCPMGPICKFVHADCDYRTLPSHSVHVNYIWRDERACIYARLPPGRRFDVHTPGLRDTVEQIESARLLRTAAFSLVAPSPCTKNAIVTATEEEEKEGEGRHVSSNKKEEEAGCGEAATGAAKAQAEEECTTASTTTITKDNDEEGREVRVSEAVTTLYHCADFCMNRMCKAGAECRYVHALYLDPATDQRYMRAPRRYFLPHICPVYMEAHEMFDCKLVQRDRLLRFEGTAQEAQQDVSSLLWLHNDLSSAALSTTDAHKEAHEQEMKEGEQREKEEYVPRENTQETAQAELPMSPAQSTVAMEAQLVQQYMQAYYSNTSTNAAATAQPVQLYGPLYYPTANNNNMSSSVPYELPLLPSSGASSYCLPATLYPHCVSQLAATAHQQQTYGTACAVQPEQHQAMPAMPCEDSNNSNNVAPPASLTDMPSVAASAYNNNNNDDTTIVTPTTAYDDAQAVGHDEEDEERKAVRQSYNTPWEHSHEEQQQQQQPSIPLVSDNDKRLSAPLPQEISTATTSAAWQQPVFFSTASTLPCQPSSLSYNNSSTAPMSSTDVPFTVQVPAVMQLGTDCVQDRAADVTPQPAEGLKADINNNNSSTSTTIATTSVVAVCVPSTGEVRAQQAGRGAYYRHDPYNISGYVMLG